MLNDRVKAVTIDGGLVSWDNVVRTPISHNQLVNVVPGALKVYDLPDLAAASPRDRSRSATRSMPRASRSRRKPRRKRTRPCARRTRRPNAADKFTLVIDAK